MEVINRFKGLALVGRVLEELWIEVCNIVQEAVSKTIPKKKKFKKAKWLSEEALQIAFLFFAKKKKKEDKQKTKQKGKDIPTECRFSEKRTERQKCLLSEQCEEIEENNRMGKTSDLFKKTGDTK